MQSTQQRHLIDPRAVRNVSLMTLVFAVGTALGTMIDFDPTTLPAPASVAIGDRSYDAVEETRADRGLSVPTGDHSYDAVEETRADRGLSVPTGDHSYDAVEETRADRGLPIAQ